MELAVFFEFDEVGFQQDFQVLGYGLGGDIEMGGDFS